MTRDPYGQILARYGFVPDDSKWVDPRRTRERHSHPYCYDEFFLWGDRASKEGCSGDYSDRLQQWDYEKHKALFSLLGKRGWREANRQQASAFLTAYHGRPIEAVALAEGCNQGNGYPYWVVWWRALAAEPSPTPAGSDEGAKRPSEPNDAAGQQ